MTFMSEAGHWYSRSGAPRYTVPNKSRPGHYRNTTIRDAIKESLVPSVTTILQLLNKPALETWKQEQILMSALTLPPVEGETLDDFKRRCWGDASAQSRESREIGTHIHGGLQGAFQGAPSDAEDLVYSESVFEALSKAFGPQWWISEQAFASKLGYGGKVDLHCETVVVDFKVKEFDKSTPIKKLVGGSTPYPELYLQLAAYREGLGLPNATMANIFVSRSVPGLVRIHQWPEGDYFQRFLCLLRFWQMTKGYDSSYSEREEAA